MKLIFCSDPLDVRRPDPAYEAEITAAEGLGIEYACVSFEALIYERDPAKAVGRVPLTSPPGLGLYRGWMLSPGRYTQLYEALAERGVRLINDPTAYLHCHYLPESYRRIEPYTPRTVWLRTGADVSTDTVMELLRPFGAAPVIVKDFVKSRKHEWEEACYIPSAADRVAVERVVRKFLDLQGEDLAEGLVFREFVEFERLGSHSKSGMPLTKEFRLFFLDHQPLCWMQYWEEGDYGSATPPLDRFHEIARSVQSCFFTMDVAKRKDGKWMVVELGDGQVAGLPESADVSAFYAALLRQWPADGETPRP